MAVVSTFISTFILVMGISLAVICFEDSEIKASIVLITTILLIVAIAVGTIWYYNNTESGKRELKDTESNTEGGITRVVTVYDINR